MNIGKFDTDEKVLIIAEIGNNHEGSYSLAEEMIGLAAEAGADAVKFQTIVPEKLVSLKQTDRITQLKQFQLTYNEFDRLSKVAKRANLIFLSTPFDIESVHFLEPLVPAYKIASGDNDFYPLIEEIAKKGKPIIMSSGLMEFEEIQNTVNFIISIWKRNEIEQELAILHCVSSYPTQSEQANLLAIKKLRNLNLTVGYSDHTLGIEAAVLSVALGARIIEKHFTIDKNYSKFHDHLLSSDPEEFGELTRRVKEALKLMGKEEKKIQEDEKRSIKTIRRSIVAKHDLLMGSTLTWNDISWVRPRDGIAPGCEELILGKKLKRSLKAGEIIYLTDLD